MSTIITPSAVRYRDSSYSRLSPEPRGGSTEIIVTSRSPFHALVKVARAPEPRAEATTFVVRRPSRRYTRRALVDA
jgi:hypothetical protein